MDKRMMRLLAMLVCMAMVVTMVPMKIAAEEMQTIPAETVVETTAAATTEETVTETTTAETTTAETTEETVVEITEEETEATVPVETIPATEEPPQQEETKAIEGTTAATEIAEEVISEDAQGTVIASGTCGENLTWELEDGVLTISGTGAMAHYVPSEIPWYNTYRSNIVAVVIEEGVTSISDYAFWGCYNLTSILIPNGVTNIGDAAFINCSSLRSIAIPVGVTNIGKSVFEECHSLTTVTIPVGVTDIGNSAFLYCYSLEEISIPDTVTSIGHWAFSTCCELTEIVIPNSVITVGQGAFEECRNLQKITIGSGVTSIGNYAFLSCNSLEELIFTGDSPTFAEDAFEEDKLTAYYPANNSTWTEDVMQHYEGSITWKPYCSVHTEVIDEAVAATCTESGLTEGIHCSVCSMVITEQDTIEATGHSFVNAICEYCGTIGGTCGENQFWVLEEEILTISGVGEMTQYTSSWDIPWRNRSVKEVVVQDGVTTISAFAFSGCDELKTIEIPDSIISIGNYAFNGCNGLTGIYIDSGNPNYSSDESGVLFDKGQQILLKAPAKLADGYAIPESVKVIDSYAFSGCKELYKITIPQNVETIADYAFEGCRNLINVEILDGVEYIGSSAFLSCTSIEKISIPDTVTYIGKSAFYNCNLLSVTIPASVESIGTDAFYSKCLEAIWVDNENERYSSDDNGVLFNKDQTTLLTVPYGITGEYTVPGTVLRIESRAFSGYGKLTRIHIPSSVTVLGANPFPSAYEGDCLTILFYGNAPEFTEVFDALGSAGITVEYPADNATWTEEVKAAFGGYVFWLAVDPDLETSGSCGETLSWNLDKETGTLTITGIGDMDSWDGVNSFAPWFPIGDMIRTVVIDAGVSSVGDHAFIRTNVEEIYFIGDAPEIGNDIQNKNDIVCYYDSNKDGWNDVISQNPGFQWITNSNTSVKSLQEIVEACESMTPEEIRAAVQALDYDELLAGMRSGAWLDEVHILDLAAGEYPNMQIDKGIPILSNHNTTFLSRTGLNLNDRINEDSPVQIILSTSTRQVTVPEGYKTEGAIPFYLSLENVQNDECLDVPVEISLFVDDIPFFWDVYWYNTTTGNVEKIPSRVEWQKVNGLHLRFVITGSGDYIVVPKSNGFISGTCGDNLTWTYDDTGTLSISGSGSMDNYGTKSNVAPWYYYREGVGYISIGDQVTSIGDYAFNDCRFTYNITIPASITTIGEGAFYYMDGAILCFKGDAPKLDENTFLSISQNVYYPAENDTWLDTIQYTYGAEEYGFKWVPIGTSGFCGENAVWSFDEKTGTLAISGIGDMAEFNVFDSEPAPWEAYNDKITKIVIEDGITSIGTGVFVECSQLTEIVIPDTVVVIQDMAFSTEKMTEITIPAGVREISPQSGISSVEQINVVDVNETFSSVEGVLFNKDHTTLVMYPAKKIGKYVVPDGVTCIGDWAFNGCVNLSEVTLPDTLTTIEEWAFSWCIGLSEITIPNSVTTIGQYAFDGCQNLQKITIGSSVTNIGDYTFEYCESLEEIIFTGDAPSVTDAVFGYSDLTATIYYPAANETWTADVMATFGGTVLWTSYEEEKVETTPMYRLYNPNSGEHFYTGSIEERETLVGVGWQYEGIAWNAPTKTGDHVHRLFNPNNGDHHYTMSLEERDMLVGVGWQYEGVAWNSASAENVPQYRLYNPNADCGSHHYTGSEEERDYLVSLGWHYEGIGWFGMLN